MQADGSWKELMASLPLLSIDTSWYLAYFCLVKMNLIKKYTYLLHSSEQGVGINNVEIYNKKKQNWKLLKIGANISRMHSESIEK